MVSDIFLRLLNMSLMASWLIVVVIILSLIARKAPRWIVCLLWGLVAIRLICPFSIESSYSLVPSEKVITKNILSELQHKRSITTGVDATINEYLGDTYHEGTSVAYDHIPMLKIGTIWVCGVLGLFFYIIIMNLWLRGHLKEAVLLQEKIYLCDYVHSPFIFGFFHPYIYLPPGIDKSDMKYVIAHEKAHLQHKDHIWKIIAFILLTIYWFNPLIWVAFVLFCRDIELACDEKVIKNLSMSEKKAYSESLLSYSLKKRVAIVYPLAFGEVGVKQRVKSILNYKKPALWVVCLSFLVCIVVGVCFLTTLPLENQIKVMALVDESSTQIQKHEKEIELEQILMDYDKDNIVKVSVFLQNSFNEVTSTNILIVSKDQNANADEQDKIKTLVSEHLNLDADNINLKYADSDTYSIQMGN